MTDLSDKALMEQRQRLREMSQGFREAQVLLTCVELGVFETLNKGPATAAAVAQKAGADPRATGLLLNTAVALGLLHKSEDQFSNKPLVAACLLPGAPGSMAHSIQLQTAFYRRWGRLAEAVRTGLRPEEDRRDEAAGDWVRNFVFGLYDMARPFAPVIAEALDLPGDQPLRVIDVGGCHGAYSLAMARRHPLLTAVVFELPAVVPFAREIVAQEGLAGRVTVQEGNFQREGLGVGYDVALVFGVLNGEPPKGRAALIRKVFDCLNPGGRIVLRDFVLDDDRTGPSEAAIFALQMLLATESGGLDTRSDWADWLALAGFTPPQAIALPDGYGGPLILAYKPS
jgi:3-hydroxy-5-methyl-1-naphthoate 3-O-methyltransferase